VITLAENFRTAKLEKFIAKQVGLMEHQQRTIEGAKKQGIAESVLSILQTNQTVTYNYTFDLCREFGIEMPHVLGVTPK
jgi:hypothetical protein